MATLQHKSLPPLPPAIRQQLDTLRAGIRRYVWLEGMAAVAVWLGAAFWGSMAIDWCFEPPRLVRECLLAVAGIGLAVVLFRFILRRAFVRLSDANMATILERQFPQLNDSLLTSVSLVDRPTESTGFNPAMLANTGQLARERLKDVRVSRVFNPMPLVRKTVIALGMALAVVLLAIVALPTLNLWAERNLLLAEKAWPRNIRLEALGFTDGVAKVAAGDNFDLRVQAFRGDTDMPVVPDKVEIRYRSEGGVRDRKTMKNIGRPVTATAAADEPLREYSYGFTGVLNSIHLDVAGGDGRIYDLQLKVVPNPILNLKLECKYPDYIERPPLTIDSVSAAVPVRVPVGSQITIHGTADKPLEMARIDCPATENSPAWHKQYVDAELGGERNAFTFEFEPFPGPPSVAIGLRADPAAVERRGGRSLQDPAKTAPTAHECTLQFSLRDTDGLKARIPIFMTLVPVPDEPPEVKVRLVGTREPVVTPKGRLPVTGMITDDHGLDRVWFEYTVEERAKLQKPSGDSSRTPSEPPKSPLKITDVVKLADLPKHPAEYAVNEASVNASQMSLAIGQKLTLAVKAADLYKFGDGPNVGSGESWELDVVSEDELLTRLEARELLVKQRFEAIVEEMTETRNLLLKMDFSPPEKGASISPKAKSAGAEPGESMEVAPKFTGKELDARRLERTLQALQNCRKNAVETADIAAAIEEIRLQLDNNQANNETRKQRIEIHVLQPLRLIVSGMFPVLENDLLDLQKQVADLSKGPERRNTALKQADRILDTMRDVLDHMMKTEDFNIYVVQRLKKIIERQKELTKRTASKEQDSLGDKE